MGVTSAAVLSGDCRSAVQDYTVRTIPPRPVLVGLKLGNCWARVQSFQAINDVREPCLSRYLSGRMWIAASARALVWILRRRATRQQWKV